MAIDDRFPETVDDPGNRGPEFEVAVADAAGAIAGGIVGKRGFLEGERGRNGARLAGSIE